MWREQLAMNNLKRPSSESELKAVLNSAYDLARQSRYDEALAVCDWLIQDKTTEVAGYRERAAIKEHMNNIEGAVTDLRIVISLQDTEPADFHTLGLLLLQNGDTVDAVAAFDRSIAIGTEEDSHYYTSSSLLFRADAHLKLTNFEEALADSENLPVGYKAYLPGTGMRSKEEIAAEANAALARRMGS
jgi:tetratricopeptide (TPR) repeat protein